MDKRLSALRLLALVGGCATVPTAPSIMVMPGETKNYDAFRADDYYCRTAAAQSIGYASPAQAGGQAAAGSAALGTLAGAAAGAAIGAAAGNAGTGAAIGAGSGLLLGSAAGAANAQATAGTLQERYDVSYAQCMAAKGNQVPPIPAPGYYSPAYSPYSAYPGYGYVYPPIIFGFGWYGGGYRGYHHGYYGGWHGGYGHHWHH
jgi:hypothetical protein